jgi:hypothetical protein
MKAELLKIDEVRTSAEIEILFHFINNKRHFCGYTFAKNFGGICYEKRTGACGVGNGFGPWRLHRKIQKRN